MEKKTSLQQEEKRVNFTLMDVNDEVRTFDEFHSQVLTFVTRTERTIFT